MSIIGILSSNLFSGSAHNSQGTRDTTPRFEQIKEQFRRLGQDLQSGNLTQAQTDYATLSNESPGASPSGAPAATSPVGIMSATTRTATTGTASAAQQFAQLGRDLQSGNLQGAQQDFANLSQSGQQNGAQSVGGHHGQGHHHHGGGVQSASANSSAQQSISQAFGTLSQDLQAGNLSGAQSAFATLQNDLQQIGGFTSSGVAGTSPASTGSSSSAGATLNVSA